MTEKNYQVDKLPNTSFNPNNFYSKSKDGFIWLPKFNTMYWMKSDNNLESGKLYMSLRHRTHMILSLNDDIMTESMQPREKKAHSLKLIINASKSNKIMNIHEDELKDKIILELKNHYFYTNQLIVIEIENDFLDIFVEFGVGRIDNSTKLEINSKSYKINIITQQLLRRELFNPNYNFEKIGVGGLNTQLVKAFRDALSTRAFKPELVSKLGVEHVKGILLHGPPGCGKTLIARKLGGILTTKPPKIVNGPEILNKFVGESEKNIREIFDDARNNSEELHIIIFDEIDAICRERGGTSAGSRVSDSLVNQLLSMIDGVNKIKNIFIIAMTNRPDLIDKALLRPGRIGVQIQIGLPDMKGREEIFRIHTRKMTENKLVDELNIEQLAQLTNNYTGAEIEAVVTAAVNLALNENLITNDVDTDKVLITQSHFLKSIKSIKPQLSNNIHNSVHQLNNTLLPIRDDVLKLLSQPTTHLFIGNYKSGKTTLVHTIAKDSNTDCVQYISSDSVINFGEAKKKEFIIEKASNCLLVNKAMLIIDDIEILIGYANFGGSVTFSNIMYQTILSILKMSQDKFTVLVCTHQLGKILESSFDYCYHLKN